ncbi:MAG: InlB B-repeat-containing protein, partial [Anaerotignum sp.]
MKVVGVTIDFSVEKELVAVNGNDVPDDFEGVTENDTLTYQITLTNEGDYLYKAPVEVTDAKFPSDVNDITVSDDNVAVTKEGNTLKLTGITLASEGTLTITYDYTVTAVDVEGDYVSNTVTIKDTNENDTDDEVTVDVPVDNGGTTTDPDNVLNFSVDKELEKVGETQVHIEYENGKYCVKDESGNIIKVEADDVLTYKIVLTSYEALNDAEVVVVDAKITDEDQITSVTVDEDDEFDSYSVSNGEVTLTDVDLEANEEIVIEYTYTVTEDDADAGEVVNRVYVDQNTRNEDDTVDDTVDEVTVPVDKEDSDSTSISSLDKRPIVVNRIPVLTNDLGYYKWEDGKLYEKKWKGIHYKWVEAILTEGDVVTYQITLENANDEALTNVEVTDSLFGKATNITYSTYGKVVRGSLVKYDSYERIETVSNVDVEDNTITIGTIPVGCKEWGTFKNGKCEITYSCEVNENSVTFDNETGTYVLHNDVSAGGKTASVTIRTDIEPAETKYTVTFHYNYTGAPKGDIYYTTKVDAGNTVARPADPTRDGDYTFLGWTTEDEVEYDFDTPVTGNLDLYAQWQAEVHSVKKVAVPTVYTDAGQKIQYFVLLENRNAEAINVLVKDEMLNDAENIYYVEVDRLLPKTPVEVESVENGKIEVPVPAQYESTVKADIEEILEKIFGSLKPGKKTMDFDFDFDFDDLDLDWEDILSELGGFKGCGKLPDIKLPECGDKEIVIPGYTILTYTYTTTDGDVGNDIVNTVKVGNKEDSATVEYKGCTIPEIGNLEFHTMFKKAIENKVNDELDGNYTVDNDPFNLGVDKINVKAGSTTAKGIVTNYYNGALNNDHWWTENLNDKIDDATKVDGLEIKVLTGWEDDGLFKQFVYQTVAVDKDHIRLAHFPEKTVPFTEIYLGFDVTFKAKDGNGDWQIVQCNGQDTNVVFFDSKDGGTITPPQVDDEDVTWYTDEACTQEWNGKIVRNTILYTGDPVTPPEEETSAIVRFYAYDADITDAQPDVEDKVDGVTLTVEAGYAFLDKSVEVEGLEPGTGSGWTEVADETASAKWMTDNGVAPASDVTVAEVFEALNARGAELAGKADDYELKLQNIGWESTDAAYHVHYVLALKEIVDEASISVTKTIEDKSVKRGAWAEYTIVVKNTGNVDLKDITVTEEPDYDVFSEGKFVDLPEGVNFVDNDNDKVKIENLAAGDKVTLTYKAKVKSNAKKGAKLENVVIVTDGNSELGKATNNEGYVHVSSSSGGSSSKNRPTKVEEVLNTEDHFQYVQGYPDNTVGPERNITRAEATVIFFRLLNDSVRAEYLDADN